MDKLLNNQEKNEFNYNHDNDNTLPLKFNNDIIQNK